MTGSIVLIGLLAVVLSNTCAGLMAGSTWAAAFLGLLLGVGFSVPLQHAITTGTMSTGQDGEFTCASKPMTYAIGFLLLVAGYVCGLLAPWVIKEG